MCLRLKSELRAIESVQNPKTIPNAKLLKSELRAIERQTYHHLKAFFLKLKSELRAIERTFCLLGLL